MNEEIKNQVKELLQADYQRLNSLTKLEQETNVSKSYLSQVLNDKADPGTATWNKLANHFKITNAGYVVIEIENLKKIHQNFKAASLLKNLSVIIGQAGAGKSTASRNYARENDNTYYLQCRAWNQKRFLEEITKVMNISCFGTAIDYVEAIRKKLSEKQNAILILDEASKLNENCLLWISEIYGDFHSTKAGIVLLGVDSLEITIAKNARRNKRGFAEMYDRVQKPIIHLKSATEKEALQICIANQVDSEYWLEQTIQQVKKSGSFRSVETAIKAKKMATL